MFCTLMSILLGPAPRHPSPPGETTTWYERGSCARPPPLALFFGGAGAAQIHDRGALRSRSAAPGLPPLGEAARAREAAEPRGRRGHVAAQVAQRRKSCAVGCRARARCLCGSAEQYSRARPPRGRGECAAPQGSPLRHAASARAAAMSETTHAGAPRAKRRFRAIVSALLFF